MERLHDGETYGEVVSGPGRATVSLSRHSRADATPWHAHDSSYVCAVIGGGFVHKRPRREHEMHAGVLVPIAAGEPHSDSFGPDGALCVNLFFDHALPPAPRRAACALRNSLSEVAVELALGLGDALTLESLAAEIVYEIAEGSAARSPPNESEVGRVIDAIESAPDANWTLAELASLAGRPASSLARAFKRRTGVTIGAWRRRRRLVRLCLDLRKSRAPLAELAQLHGFADQAHMTRCFRSFVGATPAAFRRLLGRTA
jgi:AraC family transcriptional regulator